MNNWRWWLSTKTNK